MEHAVGTMAMQECHSNLEADNHWILRRFFALLLGRFRVKYSLPARAASGGRSKVQ
jgi:hypothetical protein